MNSVVEPHGAHLLVEFVGCDPDTLKEVSYIEKSLISAVKECGGTYITHNSHRFSPEGVSSFVLIAESHISIHTWPERQYAAVDIFTCGEQMSPEVAVDYLKKAFNASDCIVKTIERGIP